MERLRIAAASYAPSSDARSRNSHELDDEEGRDEHRYIDEEERSNAVYIGAGRNRIHEYIR